jgi:hypothetical protein
VLTVAAVTARHRPFPAPKVPEVFLVFWVIKLLTTGIGETASDFLGTWNLVAAGVIGVGASSPHCGGRPAPRRTTRCATG